MKIPQRGYPEEKIQETINFLNIICVYSLFEAKIIGKLIAHLISEIEEELYAYEEKITEKNGQKTVVYEVVKKVKDDEEEKESLVLFEGKYPIKKIPIFKRKQYQKMINNYQKYPYVLDFLDYVISKKAKENNYKLNKTPEYTEKELYQYLQEFLKIQKEKVQEKSEFIKVIKRLILEKTKNS